MGACGAEGRGVAPQAEEEDKRHSPPVWRLRLFRRAYKRSVEEAMSRACERNGGKADHQDRKGGSPTHGHLASHFASGDFELRVRHRERR